MTGAAWRLVVEESLPSTSSALIGRAEAGEPEGMALLARRQTAGRGRDGRVWDSPPGNLHLSVLLRPSGPARDALQWPLLAGVALAEAAAALEEPGQPSPLRLKWPNDLLRHGAKVAGILAESAIQPGSAPPRLAWLVLGIGANLATAPSLPDGRPAATLARAEPPEDFARRLLDRLGHWRAVQAREGFAPVRAAWAALGPACGEAVTVRGSAGRDGQPLTGAFAGLAEDGGLLLDTPQGRRHIIAGEVADPATLAAKAG